MSHQNPNSSNEEAPLYARGAEKQVLLDALAFITQSDDNKHERSSPATDSKEDDERVATGSQGKTATTTNTTSKRRFVLISGASGTGKTVLVTSTLKGPTEQQMQGYFLSSKFDQFQQTSQNVIASAFGQIATKLLCRRDDDSSGDTSDSDKDDDLIGHVRNAVGRDARCLVDMIPALEALFPFQLLEEDGGDDQERQREWMQDITTLKSRTRGAFLRFVSAICRPERPVVLFLDDLQWACQNDFQVISDLMMATTTIEGGMEGLLLVGACRMVDTRHELSQFIRSLATQMPIYDLVLENLSLSNVEEYLSKIFPTMQTEDAAVLSRVVHHQTGGNFFFMRQLLENLRTEGLITIHSSDIDSHQQVVSLNKRRLEARTKTDDVLHFIVATLRQLPAEVQELLQAASCLGSIFSAKILHYVVPPRSGGASSSVEDLLMECAQKGILTSTPSSLKSSPSSSFPVLWSFVHDRFQQASYTLVPDDKKEAFHLSIGRKLLVKMTKEEITTHLLLVTRHLVAGEKLIESQIEKDQIAVLCLRAGHQLVARSNFEDAGTYIGHGLKCLGTHRWGANYELCLQLFNAGAEISYVRADYDRVEELTSEVLRNARAFDDTIETRTVVVYALGIQNRLREAIDEGCKVLDKLGEPLPRSFTYRHLFYERYRTKNSLSRYTDRGLTDLPAMKDPKKLASMRLLNLLYSYAFWSGDLRALLITYKSIQMSVKSGLCAMSGVAFVFYGSYQCLFGEIDRGNRFCDVSLRIVERFYSKQWASRVQIIAYSIVKPWKYPLRDMVEPLKKAIKYSLETGDLEYGMLGEALLVMFYFQLGESLAYCHRAACQWHEKSIKQEQNTIMNIFKPNLQAVANLYGKSEDVFLLTGAFANETDYMKKAHQDNNLIGLVMLFTSKAMVAFYLSDFELAEESIRRSMELKHAMNMSATMHFLQIFIEGMAGLAIAKPNVRRAKANIRRLKGFARHAPTVLSDKIALLEAEVASAKGRYDLAHEKFEIAIAVAQRNGSIQEHALACERASVCMSRCGKLAEAARYLSEALELYAKWGCDLKVRKIEKMLAAASAK